MRIIAGTLGGRQFESPKSFKTHPMSDKIRGALFNILGDIEGLVVLDAFAGSGAIGFEAASRGAAAITVIDNDRTAQRVVAANIQSLGLAGRVSLIKASAGAWLQTNPRTRFDIVICDPPYNDLQPSLLKRLTSTVKDEGVFVLSWPTGVELPEFPGLTLVDTRQYGDASLTFYRRDT